MEQEQQQTTLVGCLVVVLILIVAAFLLLPTRNRPRELAKRSMCQSNLKSLNTGVALYGTENSDMAPILPDMDEYAKGNCRGKPNTAPHASNGQGASGAYDYNELLCMAASCTAGGDAKLNGDRGLGAGAQQNLCLLVKFGSVGWGLFNCPSVGKFMKDRTAADAAYGLGEVDRSASTATSSIAPKTSYIHYGIQIPYETTALVGMGSDNKNQCPMSGNMDPKVVWLADRGPCALAKPGQSAPDTCTRFSPNHENGGENCLFGDGHVEFCKDANSIQKSSNGAYPDNFTYKNASGWDRNNIYTHDYWQAVPAPSTTESTVTPKTSAATKSFAPVLVKHGTKTETPVITAAGDMPTKDSVIYDWMMFP